jgi:hypothetical protein
MKKLLHAILFIAILSNCTSDEDFEKGKKQLLNQGYTEIENTGHSSFCCGKDDNFSTGFKCKDKNGNIVEGCFCSSAFKGITIRFK